MFRTPIRRMATAARQSLKIGLIPADGIGKEVIPAARTVLEALGSDIPKPEFIDLLAGWEVFTRSGTALPEETVECVNVPHNGRVLRLGSDWGWCAGRCGSVTVRFSVLSGM